MTVNLLRLGPLVKAVNALTEQVRRIADAYESHLAHTESIHMRPPVADTSGPEPEAFYTDEELQWIREQVEARGKMTPELEQLFDGVTEDRHDG